jgi:TIR domain
MPEPTAEFAGYSYVYEDKARTMLEQLPVDLQPKVRDLIDDLADNPDAYPARVQSIGQSPNGELVLYTHPDFPLEITYAIDRQNRKISFMHFACRLVELKQVFVSYCHNDVKWLERLKEFLKPLENQGLLRVWDDTKIQTGAAWQSEIEKSLKSAKMAVFLVTQDFLNSDFIQHQEMPPLLERAAREGVKIYWIAVGSCTVEDSVLYQFEAANDPKKPLEMLPKAKRNQVMVDIYKKIKAGVS